MKRFAAWISVILLVAGCGNGEESPSNEESSTQPVEESASVVFQDLDLKTDGNKFHLLGEVNTENSAFYYRIEHSGEVIQEEESYEVEEAVEWASFEIEGEVASEFIGNDEAPIIVMYGKSSDGEVVNPNYIPIDF